MEYTVQNILKIAKRINNTKRNYLLVNPLQAKHIPVAPKKSLGMMRTLGKSLAAKYPDTGLVIGFAETATAIGAAVCESFSDECVYIHTTRENFAGNFVYFSEEHSHAAEQKLCAEGLSEFIKSTPQIILIDDEISTGKTLINIVNCLKNRFPEAKEKKFIAASIINRVSPENEERLRENGITSEYLVKIESDDFSEEAEKFSVREAEKIMEKIQPEVEIIRLKEKLPDARKCVKAGYYKQKIYEIMASAEDCLKLPKNADLLVLGTEECMYPSLIFGEISEERNGGRVLCHSTTRSPIGISDDENYPINSGVKLRSFYDDSRETFIYDLAPHDFVVIISDSEGDISAGLGDLAAALADCGCGKIFAVFPKKD